MNAPLLMAEKLKGLIDLARTADTEFEKCAVFAAVHAIASMFDEQEDKFDGYALEKVSQVQWHVSAALGYDITNGHDESSHISWAYGAATTLIDVLGRQSKGQS